MSNAILLVLVLHTVFILHVSYQKLSNQYKKIEEYMAANKLVINGDKTHLVVMGSSAHTAKRQEVRLQAGNHTILPSPNEKLLGGIISQDLKWRQHLLDSD